MKKYIKTDIYKMDLKEALKIVKNQYKDYTIFLVGSFYIYGSVKNILEKCT